MKSEDQQKLELEKLKATLKTHRRLVRKTMQESGGGWDGGCNDLQSAAGHFWNESILSAAALVQEAYEAESVARLADEGVSRERAVAACAAAGRAVSFVWEMLLPVMQWKIFTFGQAHKAELFRDQVISVLYGFPKKLVKNIPAWGGDKFEKCRARPFFHGNGSGLVNAADVDEGAVVEEAIQAGFWSSVEQEGAEAPDGPIEERCCDDGGGGEDDSSMPIPAWMSEAYEWAGAEFEDAMKDIEEQRFPDAPADCGKLAEVFRWQKRVLSAAADIQAGLAAERLVAAERKRVKGPLPFGGVVEASVALAERALKAKEGLKDDLELFEQAGGKGDRRGARRLLDDSFLVRLLPPLPPWEVVRDSCVKSRMGERLKGIRKAAYDMAGESFGLDFAAAVYRLGELAGRDR